MIMSPYNSNSYLFKNCSSPFDCAPKNFQNTEKNEEYDEFEYEYKWENEFKFFKEKITNEDLMPTKDTIQKNSDLVLSRSESEASCSTKYF